MSKRLIGILGIVIFLLCFVVIAYACVDVSSSSSYNSYSSSNSTSSSYSTSKCEYKYADGSKCGAKCSSGKTLCDKHMKELTDIYNSFTGN